MKDYFGIVKMPQKEKDKGVVLLQSGGLDSCYLARLFQVLGFKNIHHVFVDYGQNSVNKEWESAQKICEAYTGTLHRVQLNMPWLSTSCDLVGNHVVNSRPDLSDRLGAVAGGVYVPMRNHLLISIASSLAESLNIKYIATGIDGAQDIFGRPLHGTPDKHPNFAKKLEKSLTESSCIKHKNHDRIELLCPIIGFEKFETIYFGLHYDCDFSLSWSCYNTGDKPCCHCDACLQRIEAFERLGKKDPIL